MFLTVIALILGYLTLSVSTAILYAIWMTSLGTSTNSLGGEIPVMTSQFMAFAGVCGLGFATLSGYIVGLVARRAPVAHAAAFSLMLMVIWVASRFLGESDESLLISILNIAIALTGAMTGGWIRSIQMQTAAANAAEMNSAEMNSTQIKR